MKRLISKGLMFGNLMEVATPTLVARYNAALEKLTGRRTALTEFHVDLSGFSPEVGDEQGDMLYLNPDGGNRMFIVLSPAQGAAPLLNARFSTTRSVLRHFLSDNAATIAALTAREAVIGELVNSVWRLTRPQDVLALHTITVEANTTTGRVTDAQKLSAMIEAFRAEEHLWHDDAHTEAMLALAARTGDVTTQPVAFGKTVYRQGNFHTTHFGGLYLFRDVRHPFLLWRAPEVAQAQMPGVEKLSIGDRTDVGHALQVNALIEPLHAAKGVNAAAILRQRLDFMLVDCLAAEAAGPDDLARLTRADLRRIAQRRLGALPPEFETVATALAALENGRRPNLPGYADPGFFYLHRAVPGPDRDLVNQLLAEFTPLDIRQLFICNKPAFYAAFGGWPERKQDYVAEFLAREYAMDKAGTRVRLYGGEPAMEEEGVPISPWGPRPKD